MHTESCGTLHFLRQEQAAEIPVTETTFTISTMYLKNKNKSMAETKAGDTARNAKGL